MTTALGDRRRAVHDITRPTEEPSELRSYALSDAAHFELHSASDSNFSKDNHKQSDLNHRKEYENEAYAVDEDEATGNTNADTNKHSNGHMTFCLEEDNENESGLKCDIQESEIVVESSEL